MKTPTPAYMFGGEFDRAKKTKKNIKILQEHTVIIGSKHFHAPKSVKNNPIAKAKWVEIMNLYRESDIPITTTADIGILERYCLTYWEYKQLIETKLAIAKKYPDDPIAQASHINKLRLDTKINQKNALLARMDEQLFLTPLSKCRAIPRKKSDPKEDMLKKKGFSL